MSLRHMRPLTTYLLFRQVGRRFHGRESNQVGVVNLWNISIFCGKRFLKLVKDISVSTLVSACHLWGMKSIYVLALHIIILLGAREVCSFVSVLLNTDFQFPNISVHYKSAIVFIVELRKWSYNSWVTWFFCFFVFFLAQIGNLIVKEPKLQPTHANQRKPSGTT